MTTSIEIHQVGSIGGDSGRLHFSYVPDDNSVSVYASVPSDRRRAGIHVRVMSVSALRVIVDELERLEQAAKKRRDDKARPALDDNGATFKVMNTDLFTTDEVLERASKLVAKGDNQGLIKEIERSFPLLHQEAVYELTRLIYVHFRPRA